MAVIDSGIDATHPEFAGKIADAKSFVGGSARVDDEGHGTFVAGLIAAGVDNAVGIAGMSPSAELLVAKVVNGDDLIDVEAEVKAIHWAVENGAQVINMSLGGFRDPRDPDRDAFSPLEAAAIGWAHGKGVVIVAAVGNSDEAPTAPWPFASYPAALPHVLGVSALARDGSVPALLQPRQDLQRHHGAGSGDRLHVPARPDRGLEGVRRSRATRPAPTTSSRTSARARERPSPRRR